MSFINSLYFLSLTYNLCLAEIKRRRTLFLMELAPVYKRHYYYYYYYYMTDMSIQVHMAIKHHPKALTRGNRKNNVLLYSARGLQKN